MEALARPLLFANMAGIWAYIVLWQGTQRFFIESHANWVISPLIYSRICPELFRADLIRALARHRILGDMFCAVPVVIVAVAVACGVLAYRRRSFPLACAACVLMSLVFVVYHSVKHLGLQLIVG